MFRTILCSDQIQSNLGKNTEINKNRMSSFGLIEKNMELSHIYLSVLVYNVSYSGRPSSRRLGWNSCFAFPFDC